MITIGVTGKIASGKSSICRYLKTFEGVIHIDVDKLVHEVLDYPELRDLIHMKLGKQTFNWYHISNEALRRRLSKLAFDNPDVLEFLEEITLGPLQDLVEEKVFRYTNKYVNFILLESAAIYRMPFAQWICDGFIEVDTPDEDRLKNFLHRSGFKNQELVDKFNAVSSIQDIKMPEEWDKKAIVLRNDKGDFNHACKQADEIIGNLAKEAEQLASNG